MALIPPQIRHEMRGFCCWKLSFYHENIECSLWQLQMRGDSHLCSGGGISQSLQRVFAFSIRNGKCFTLEHLPECPGNTGVHTQVITKGRLEGQFECQPSEAPLRGHPWEWSAPFLPVKGKKCVFIDCASPWQGTWGTQPFTVCGNPVLPPACSYMSPSTLDDTASPLLWLKKMSLRWQFHLRRCNVIQLQEFPWLLCVFALRNVKESETEDNCVHVWDILISCPNLEVIFVEQGKKPNEWGEKNLTDKKTRCRRAKSVFLMSSSILVWVEKSNSFLRKLSKIWLPSNLKQMLKS